MQNIIHFIFKLYANMHAISMADNFLIFFSPMRNIIIIRKKFRLIKIKINLFSFVSENLHHS